MTTKTLLTILLCPLAGIVNVFSQSYTQPAIGLKSPETIEILKAELTAEKTVLHLSVENRIAGGAFCADKNIFIIYPDGTRVKLVKASDIPQCPDSYKFKTIGEKLSFTLTFPPLKSGTKWIDLVEDCNDNCFVIYGILLNNELTGKIDEAVALVDRGDIDSAIGMYKKIIENTDKAYNGITGSLYSDLISLLIKRGYTAQGEEWYKKMVSSGIPRVQLYLSNLNSRGIKF